MAIGESPEPAGQGPVHNMHADRAKPLTPKMLSWWRRGESNPRPKSAAPRSLHAYLSSISFASRAQNEQETQPASPMNLARTLRTERFRPAHCV